MVAEVMVASVTRVDVEGAGESFADFKVRDRGGEMYWKELRQSGIAEVEGGGCFRYDKLVCSDQSASVCWSREMGRDDGG